MCPKTPENIFNRYKKEEKNSKNPFFINNSYKKEEEKKSFSKAESKSFNKFFANFPERMRSFFDVFL